MHRISTATGNIESVLTAPERLADALLEALDVIDTASRAAERPVSSRIRLCDSLPGSSTPRVCGCPAVRTGLKRRPYLAMHNLTRYLADAHTEDLRRDFRRAQSVRVDAGNGKAPVHDPITIRRAEPSDAAELKRVAELDSSKAPTAPVILAAVGGELRAALSLADRTIVADPFHETVAIVELLQAWAWHELKGRDAGLRHRLRRTVRRRTRRVDSADRSRPAWDLR
jgi:hypothetical protein